MATNSKPNVKAWVARLILLLTSILLCWGLLEVALRIFLPQIAWTQREDPLLGWSSREYQEFNPQAARAPKRKRILFIGDSFLAGSGVSSLEHRFPDVMHKRMRGTCDVAILASGGWGTDQELLAYEEKGAAWRPDVVVLAFTANNDLANILSHNYGPRMLKPYYVYSQTNGLTLHAPDGRQAAHVNADALKQARTPDPLWKRSLLLRLAALKVRGLVSRKRYDPTAFPLVDERYKKFLFWEQPKEEICDKQKTLSWSPQMGVNRVSAYIHEDFPINTYQWQLLEQLLVRLHSDVERDRAQLVVMPLPVIFNPRDPDTIVGGPFTQRFQTPDGQFTFRAAEPRDRLAEICARQKIPFFDPTDEFREHVRERSLVNEFWPLPKEGHFADPAHAYLGEICERWFTSLLKESALQSTQ